MTLSTWLLCVAAVLVLTVTPGPSVIMCISTSVQHGPRRAMIASLGSTSAIACIILLSMRGLGTVLAASETLFSTLKWLGAGYLAYPQVSPRYCQRHRASPCPTHRCRRSAPTRCLAMASLSAPATQRHSCSSFRCSRSSLTLPRHKRPNSRSLGSRSSSSSCSGVNGFSSMHLPQQEPVIGGKNHARTVHICVGHIQTRLRRTDSGLVSLHVSQQGIPQYGVDAGLISAGFIAPQFKDHIRVNQITHSAISRAD